MTPQQTRKLRAKVNPKHVRLREMNGIKLRYLEGWHIIAEANRIFGFDGWDRETLETKCVYARANNSEFTSAYIVRVRVRVHTEKRIVVREGTGTGESRATTIGQAHEIALKAAETDATKRAFITFGNAFGLSLYQNENAAEKNQGAAAQNQTCKPCSSGSRPKIERKPSNAGIDKSKLTLGAPVRIRDKRHLQFVASHPCVICGRNRSQAHHLTFAQPKGMSIKVSDEFTVPLCSTHHRELHQFGNEAAWWDRHGIEPTEIAKNLWGKSMLRFDPKAKSA